MFKGLIQQRMLDWQGQITQTLITVSKQGSLVITLNTTHLF